MGMEDITRIFLTLAVVLRGWFIAYAIFAALVAGLIQYGNPAARARSVVFWSAAFMPLLGMLLGLGLLIMNIIASRLYPVDKDGGYAIGAYLALAVCCVSLCAATGSASALLVVLLRKMVVAPR
jgi:hypothetical protein